ncbi:MAG: Phytanoyl-CoA dioxygenase [Acidimicrobiia bacterium]|nr:Phytanoyl-CoA dioxygenase [Acidimicrobiia bacterium]
MDVVNLSHPDAAIFGLGETDALGRFYDEFGFAVLRGLWTEAELQEFERACVSAQQRLIDGELPERYGTTILIDDATHQVAFANYVTHLTELVPRVREAIGHRVIEDLVSGWLGDEHWLLESERFGVVYQDARPSQTSGYSRIGWHSDWQSGPHLAVWPSTAFTLHIDATSPDNGFLRVAPGSHRWATPAPYENVNGALVPDGSAATGGYGDDPPPVPMPLRFGKVPGEIALYCERGDLLFHDAYLWHSAARATDDDGVRRHVRGSWYTGTPFHGATGSIEDFVKNAAR